MTEDTEYKGPESNWFMRHPSVMMTALAAFFVVANAALQHWHAEQLAPELAKVHDSIDRLERHDWSLAEYILNRDHEFMRLIRAIAEGSGVDVEEPSEELGLSRARVRNIYAGVSDE